MIKRIILFCFLFSPLLIISQNIDFEIELNNVSKDINDGFVKIKVTKGTEPYTIYWSKQDVALNSESAGGFTEGEKYFVQITDYTGNVNKKDFVIPAKSINEHINSSVKPIVNFMDKVIMADIFALLHIYDPTIKDEKGQTMLYPNGDTRKMKIPFIVLWLVTGALFFTIYLGFANFKYFKLAIQHVTGKFDKNKGSGEVSHFQALSTALSGTVGLGNIAGVAIAVTIGGPGATIWMIIAGLLGMSTKFVECTLGVKYRNIDEKGVVSGGPMYYMKKAMKNYGMGKLGAIFSVIFAILVIGGSLGGGNMFQANQAFSQLSNIIPALKGNGAIFGVLLSILIGAVVIGGIKSIAKVTDKIVPFMAVLYVAAALVVIIMHIDQTPTALKIIWNGAFSPGALKGGILGVLIVGFQRAAFSNEAGVGSASIAHSAVKTDYPITEGLVSFLEPFIDTVVICTMTALVIVFTGMYTNPQGLDGVSLTSSAFASIFSWFPYVLTIAVFLFAFSTMISWSYYGLNGFKFLFGNIIKNEKALRNTYYFIFLSFTIIGAASNLGSVVDFSDMMILTMAFPNIFALYVLSKEVKTDMKNYINKIKFDKSE